MRTAHIIVGLASLLTALTVCPLLAAGQVDRRGYDSLPPMDESNRKAHWLLGAARDFEAYRTLTVKQRSTYEAIIHALHSQRLLDIVDAVTAIWGVPVDDTTGLRSRGGNEQFRLSVILSRDAIDVLQRRRFQAGRWWSGHVKLANGAPGRQPRDMRERGIPSLQVSWSARDPRLGEIDIDYRGRGWSHGYAANSDIRAEHDGTSHYCLHKSKYRSRLLDWWNATPEDCDAPLSETPLEGWAQLGLTGVRTSWVFDMQSLEPGSRIRASQEVRVHSILYRDAPILKFMTAGECALLVELNDRRYRGESWIRIQPVDCEDPLE